jgi:mRNA turnover protein 4
VLIRSSACSFPLYLCALPIRFFLGKNKVMQLALGKTNEEELKSGLARLAQCVTGSRGLLFTDKSEEEVTEFFSSFRASHFARSGFECQGNYKLAVGPLPADRCPHPMEPMLRKLGLPTKLHQGKIELLNDVNVASKGDVLTPEQCKIMEVFGVKLAKFQVEVLYKWENGVVTEVEQTQKEEEEEEEEEETSDEPIELREIGDAAFVVDLDNEEEDEDEDIDM